MATNTHINKPDPLDEPIPDYDRRNFQIVALFVPDRGSTGYAVTSEDKWIACVTFFCDSIVQAVEEGIFWTSANIVPRRWERYRYYWPEEHAWYPIS